MNCSKCSGNSSEVITILGSCIHEVRFVAISQAVYAERKRQDAKWGTVDERNMSISGFLLVAKLELDEAIMGWAKNISPPHDVRSELIQIAAVCIAALETHGLTPTEGEKV